MCLVEHDIIFEAEIAEIGAALDDWSGEGVHLLAERDRPFEALISEMTDGDDDPFFVNLVIAREGLGRGKPRPKFYTSKAIEDVGRLLPGVQGYLGHQRPGDRDFEYRPPQLKIVKSRVDTERDPRTGKAIRVARAKGYVSRRSADLRTHIREKMAGPISLQGRAVLVTKGDRTEVTEMLSLRCVDFCNPGTEGIAGAGVEDVVSEMEQSDGERSRRMAERLTRDQLQVEYGAEIREMIREGAERAVEDAREALEAELSEMTTRATSLEGDLAVARDRTGELEATLETRDREVVEMRGQIDGLRNREARRSLEDHRAAAIKKVAGEQRLSTQVQEMLSRRVPAVVLEGDEDLARSRTAIDEGVGAALKEIQEIAEMSGGSLRGRRPPATGGAGGGNPPRRKGGEAQGDLADLLLARGRKALARGRRATDDDEE